MKKTVKVTSLLLALLMLGCSAAGCSKDERKGDSPETKQGKVTEGEVIEKPTVLTGVYKGISLSLEDEEYLNSDIKPLVDKENNCMSFMTTRYEENETTEEDGSIYYEHKVINSLVKVDMDLNILERTNLDLGDRIYLDNGALTDDSLYFVTDEYDENTRSSIYYIKKYDMTTGETVTSSPLNAMFETGVGSDWFYISKMAVDNDENIYLGTEQEIAVFAPDFTKLYSIQINNWINSMSSSSDGRVFISQYTDGGMGLFEIDKTNCQLSAEPVYTFNNIDETLCGDGYDIFISSSTGLMGINIGSEPELLMNYLNSDVNSDNFTPVSIIDKDTILALEYVTNSEGYNDRVIALYKKSDDIDLSQIKLFEIAAPNGVDYDLKSQIAAYNKSHKDTRINLTDYSQYETTEDWTAGITKLGTDLANGLYKPDMIIIDSYNCETIRDYIIKNNLFVDYNELLKNEPEVLDDMFGGVKRALTTTDGRMWGITKEFQVDTLLTNDPALMDKSSWTLDEMLDYSASLPEGRVLMDNVYQEYFFNTNASSYYESFVDMDNYTCNFENETFYKLLNYIIGLPTLEVYQQQMVQYYSSENTNRYEQYQSGKVALYQSNLYDVTEWVRNQVTFNSPDYSAIGYPTDTGYGTIAQPDNTFMITTWCDDTAGAWDFVKGAVTVELDENSRGMRYMSGIPAFKSVFNYSCDTYINDNYVFEIYYSGGASWGPRENDEEVEMAEPGVIAKFTREAADKFYDLLDNKTGGAITSSIPEEVMDIIGEEVSSFASGVNTAENCAAKIQSRVSIWLSEHE